MEIPNHRRKAITDSSADMTRPKFLLGIARSHEPAIVHMSTPLIALVLLQQLVRWRKMINIKTTYTIEATGGLFHPLVVESYGTYVVLQ